MYKKKIWVVTGHSFTNQHSYIVGVYDSKLDAERAANIEGTNRAGKYNMRTESYVLNEMPDDLNDILRDNEWMPDNLTDIERDNE